ncbi:hypothetical protein L6452_34116 [Arctium lappa]|uniref:Uncharacterized protein n=1 Tax=Arctium lappa TaxID=4217 RepID=A0ACB8YHW2_ARCLA|nr:hypothetical protein L6452_34116 [Arctium lappa]
MSLTLKVQSISVCFCIHRSRFISPIPNPRSMATEEPIVVAEVVGAAETVAAEEKPSVEAAEVKPKKSRKTSAKSKPKSPSLHPPYFEMIKDAIVTLKEKTGSSQHAITKFIEEKHKNLPVNFTKILLTQLKKFVAASKLVKVKASYKLPATKAPAAAAAAPAKKKPAAKPKATAAAAKPNPTAKKSLKKKVSSKPKPVPKAKAVAKPKASKAKPAAKPKTAAPKVVAKPAAKPKAVKSPAKVGRTSRRLSPGKKSGAVPRKASVRKGKK